MALCERIPLFFKACRKWLQQPRPRDLGPLLPVQDRIDDIGREQGQPQDAGHVAKRIETGICHINGPTVHDEAQMPFGGVKASGYGRFGGNAAIHDFTELRWITIQDGPVHYPI